MMRRRRAIRRREAMVLTRLAGTRSDITTTAVVVLGAVPVVGRCDGLMVYDHNGGMAMWMMDDGRLNNMAVTMSGMQEFEGGRV